MPKVLGDAVIVISASTIGFRQDADAQLRKALTGLRPQVTLGVNTSDVTGALAALQAKITAISGGLAKMRLSVKTTDADAKITALQAKLLALTRQISSITMKADTTKLDASIAAEQAKVAGLKQQLSNLQIDADSAKALSKIANLEKEAFHLQEALGSMELDVDVAAAEARLRAIDAELRVLNDNARTVQLRADNKALLAAVAASQARITALKAQAADIRIGANIDTGKLLAAEAGVLGIEAAMEKLVPAAAKGDVALGVLGKAITGTGTGWAFLTRDITLFGGVFNRVLPMIATSVKVWHVLADGIIEVAAVWVPAALAVGAFAVAASDAAVDIVNRMTAVHTVMDATGQSIPPMTRSLENLHDAVRPEVYQLFGEALTVMNSRTGTFSQVAKATGTVLDQLGARIVFAVTASNKLGTSTTQLSQFWQTAITDVSKLGDSIGNVFGIFGNFFKAIPGFASGLLTIGDDFTHILESASAASVPVLKWILLLHGYILYTGLAVTATLGLIGGIASLVKSFFTLAAASALSGIGALKAFGTVLVTIGLAIAAWVEEIVAAEGAAASFGVALAPLAANPMLWVAAAAVALGALVFAIIRSKDAAQQFNSTLQQTIASAGLSSVISVIQSAQAATSAKLAASTQQLSAATTAYSKAEHGRYTSSAQARAAIADLSATTDHYRAGLNQLDAQQQLVSSRFGDLTKRYGGGTAALGLLNAAGITGAQITSTQGHAWAEALIQISATVQAYTAMGTQAGALGNDLDVLGRTVTDQYQAVQKLNQGWSAFITDVTSGQGAFDTVAQGMETLATHSGDLKLSLGKLKTSFADTASGLTATGAVASATAAVASAQNSLNKLQVSGKGSALQLTAAHARLAGAEDRLAASQQKLSAMQSQGKAAIDALTPAGIALNQAFTDQVGNVDKLFASWRTAGLAGNLFTQGVVAAIAPLEKYAAGSQEATAQLVALAEEAGYQGPVSLQALNKYLGISSGMLKNTAGSTKTLKDVTDQATTQEALLTGAMQAQGSFIAGTLIGDINNAILKYNGVEKAATAYGNAVARSGQQSDAAHAARTVLINDLIKSGTAANDSKGQIAAMITKVLGIPAKEALQIVMTGTGSYSLSEINAKTGKQQQAAAGGYLNLAGRVMRAAGGYINMGSGPVADDVPIMASKGEYVIQAKSVSKYGKPVMDKINAGVFAQGGLIPGYAGGGLLERGDLSVLSGQRAVTMDNSFKAAFQAAMIAQMRASLKAAEAAAAAAAAKAAAVGGPGGSITPGLISVAKYVLAHGGNKAAAAGIAGVIAGESGGNPEARQIGGGGGEGIMQWTPGTSARPYYPIITGNPGKDMSNQLADMMFYIAGRGGLGSINAAGSPLGSAEVFSRMEAPAVPGSDIRPDVVASMYAQGYAAGGMVPGMAAGGTVASFQAALARAQAGERAKYFGLEHSFAIGPAKYRTRTVKSELATLAKRQAAELAAFAKLTGKGGLTSANLKSLATIAGPVWTTSRDQALSHMPGGHPLFARDLQHYLGTLGTLGRAGLPPGPPNPPWNPGSLGPSYSIPSPGVETFDKGGYLRPGLNLAWNGTGKPERVGGGTGDVHLHLHVNGPVGSQTELENWFVKTANSTARTGRLSQAVKRAGQG